jgi:hypothetical protein
MHISIVSVNCEMYHGSWQYAGCRWQHKLALLSCCAYSAVLHYRTACFLLRQMMTDRVIEIRLSPNIKKIKKCTTNKNKETQCVYVYDERSRRIFWLWSKKRPCYSNFVCFTTKCMSMFHATEFSMVISINSGYICPQRRRTTTSADESTSSNFKRLYR